MKKECEYCGNENNATRSDSKYCSGACKSQAYLARKTNPEIGAIDDKSMNNTSSRNSRRNVKASIPFSSSQVDKLLNSGRLNTQMFNTLMGDKERIGEIKSEKSMLQIEMRFLQKDLENALKEIEDLKWQNKELKGKIDSSEAPFVDRIMSYLENYPAIGAIILEKLASSNLINAIGGTVSTTSTQDVPIQTEKSEIPKEEIK